MTAFAFTACEPWNSLMRSETPWDFFGTPRGAISGTWPEFASVAGWGRSS